MKVCEDCGERVYNLGCTNCNEPAYIEEQERLDALRDYGEPRYRESPKPASSPSVDGKEKE